MKSFRRKEAMRGDETSEFLENQTSLDDVLAREGLAEADRRQSRSDTARGRKKNAKATPETLVNAARSVS